MTNKTERSQVGLGNQSSTLQEVEQLISDGLALADSRTGRVRLTARGRRRFGDYLRILKLDPHRVMTPADLSALGRCEAEEYSFAPLEDGQEYVDEWANIPFFTK